MAVLTDRTAHEWLCLHNATRAELNLREREIAGRVPLLDNAHLKDSRADELRAQLPAIKKSVIAATIMECNRDRAIAERELAEMRAELVAARALLAGDQMALTGAQIAAANAVLARETAIRQRITDCDVRAHAAPTLVDGL